METLGISNLKELAVEIIRAVDVIIEKGSDGKISWIERIFSVTPAITSLLNNFAKDRLKRTKSEIKDLSVTEIKELTDAISVELQEAINSEEKREAIENITNAVLSLITGISELAFEIKKLKQQK